MCPSPPRARTGSRSPSPGGRKPRRPAPGRRRPPARGPPRGGARPPPPARGRRRRRAPPPSPAPTAIFDGALAFFTTAAILCFRDDRPVLAWAAMALGALTKGPVALAVPLCAIVPWALVTGVAVRRLAPARALVAFALLALPWFVAVSLRHPEFPHYAFVRETLDRFTTASFRPTPPVRDYFPIVPLPPLPWILPALPRLPSWRWGWPPPRGNQHAP